MSTNNKAGKTNFLSDKPISADQFQDIKFGHESIAHNLAEIIAESPTPFSIGLFGKWGSGKTTIINLLKKYLEQKEITIAIVDAWKYEGDSFRRQFLISLDEELGLNLSYANILNQSLTEADPTKGELKFDWKIFFNYWSLLFGLFFITPIFLKYFNNASIALDLTQAFGLFGILFQAVLGLFKRVSVTITEHRTDSAEGFERFFTKGILAHKKIKGKRLLIVIDNLDRCSDQKTVELLSTIKTFLAKDNETENKCVFLITCDDEAIKTHLNNIYSKDLNNASLDLNNASFNADEFLRKFFNVSLIIPPFIDTELQGYTEDLLKYTGIKDLDNPEVAYVITYSFRDNPRQIKQFINTLLAHYLLAQRREQEPNPTITSKGIVTGNVAFLAKMLIIRQQFPNIYDLVIKRHLTLEDIPVNEENKLCNDFIVATRTVTAPDMRPFIYLKQSKEEVSIPKFDELVIALIDNKMETVNNLLKEIKADKVQLSSFNLFIPSLIERYGVKEIPLLNIISSLLAGLKNHSITLRNESYNRIAKALTKGGALNSNLDKLSPELLFNELLGHCSQQDRMGILNSYINILVLRQG